MDKILKKKKVPYESNRERQKTQGGLGQRRKGGNRNDKEESKQNMKSAQPQQ